ncbi:hypothetical protein C488_01964 [Natrinema pellirubrum DSM 15624]|uniref:DUF7827 domain-containing protein n=1 Tax=Natrinema pellirubrum (strain DSM 15624 / CIP 106293 / JCM 10476 / NCIMB 786 / 157) TaxID=797303 RepID=L0JL63_NATP1|nr:hypothetical protein [Natrinema pellirubrum]AGB31101.1 hypothetical protein Natpe_1195 [Natrinema pellirubrum DSM 15624]ELY81247.1 hypothetical protein C488_01964 [Natrinema pellirubrum DSM 15624]
MQLRTALLPTLFALCLLLSTVTVGVGVATTDVTNGTETEPEPADGTVGFAAAETVDQRGDVATIRLEFTNTDETDLLIRSAQRNYRADLRVRDENNDGTVHVRFNTFRGLERDGRPAFAAAGADSATVREQSTTQSLPVLESGRYNLIAATETSRVAAVLRLDDATSGESRSMVVAPNSTAEFDRTVTAESLTNEREVPTRVAQGDRDRVEFEVSGVEGLLEGATPNDRLVFANDSRPGAETTHYLRLSPDRDLETVRTMAIDYDDSGGAAPNVQGLGWRNIAALGVDSNGDGRVDRTLKHAVTGVRTTSDGELEVRFDGSVTISDSETLIAAYRATNPSESGTADVRVSFDSGQYVETGTVGYGLPSQGTLGHGVDLRLRSADDPSASVPPLAATTVAYEPTTNTLTAAVDTASLETGTYAVQLRIDEESPLDHERTVLREEFTVVPRSVTISNTGLTNESTLAVATSTNLAPGSPVTIRVRTDSLQGGYLIERSSTVDRDGTASCEFDLLDTESPLLISVRQNDSVLAGPIEYEPSTSETS